MRTALITLLLFGCGDGPLAVDAGPDAAPRDPCPLVVGGLPACNGECPWSCESGSRCRQEVCIPNRFETCGVFSVSEQTNFCSDSSLCASERISETSLIGTCVPEAYCREVADTSIRSRCFYADFSEYVNGPPIETECPSAPHPTSPFCGGPCGGCPPITDEEVRIDDVGCIGRSETRGLGICVLTDSTCSESDPLSNFGRADDDPPVLPGIRNVACMVYQDVPQLEQGWLTRRDACLAYRDRYSGAVECRDHNWELLP
ncbi:MAG: hypothetical protein AAGE52_31505 [Myxococcota bacterium]